MQAVAEAPAPAVARKPRRRVSQETRPAVDQRKKLGIYLSVEAYHRLGVHAMMSGEDLSTVIEGLVTQHLRRYGISDRARAVSEATPIESAA